MSGCVTIKAGTAYDAPWIVAEAPNDIAPDQQVAHQRAYILAAFGMSPEDPDIVDLSLAEIAAQASGHLQGVWAAAQGLGAKGSSADVGEAPKAAKPPAKARAAASKPKAPAPEPTPEPVVEDRSAEANETVPQAAPAAEGHPFQEVLDEITSPFADVLAEIAAATTKKELQAIFHGNKEAMADAGVLDALKARTKAVAS